MTAWFHVGDSLTVLRTLPDASVDLVLTSPPFLALRSYLPADHPDKGREMGSEGSPGAFIDALLGIVEECRRVLAPHGSICVELGDTYSAARGYGSEGSNPLYGDRADERLREARVGRNFKRKGDTEWPEEKSLCLIPELFRLALVYGGNPLTGRSTPRWRVRNVIRWCRPNPPVGSLSDKMRPATSDMVVACVGRKRYFDLDAVRQVGVEPGVVKTHSTFTANDRQGWGGNNAEIRQNPAGAPPLDNWWEDDDRFDQDAWLIPTAPYKGAHYATFPERLVTRPILAMCPSRVCTTCGKPSERITEPTAGATRKISALTEASETARINVEQSNRPVGQYQAPRDREGDRNVVRSVSTTGWTDCGHGSTWRNGLVLDPFCGSGTVLAVANGHGRDAIGIDLDERNAALVRERCGMFLADT